jgi:GT2 family glycosyltransferase
MSKRLNIIMNNVTAIVTTYNRPKMLAKCLTALAKQEVSNIDLEIIVIDDFSTPINLVKSKLICERYSNVQYFSNPKNMGLSASRNAGAKLAKGELLLFLDDDIVVECLYVRGHVDFFNRHSNIATVGSLRFPPDMCKKSNVIRYLNSRELRQRNLPEILLNDLKPGQFGGGICGLRKVDYERVSGFNEEFIHYGGEDVAMGASLVNVGIRIVYVATAKADHYDQATLDRYKAKTIESTKYGLKLISAKNSDVIQNSKLKYLLPIESSDSIGLIISKKVVRIFLNRIVEFFLCYLAKKTNTYSIFYSNTLLHILFACWMIHGLNQNDDKSPQLSIVQYNDN